VRTITLQYTTLYGDWYSTFEYDSLLYIAANQLDQFTMGSVIKAQNINNITVDGCYVSFWNFAAQGAFIDAS
jgi:hypothetical protein